MTHTEKTALITGAAQGVGRAVAIGLANNGYTRLILVDQNESGLRSLANDIDKDTPSCTVISLAEDLIDVETTTSAISKILHTVGTLDVMINAAGITTRGGVKDITVENFDKIIAVNTRAPLFLIQAVLPYLKVGSVIVNIASMLAYGGPPFLLAYSASKSALVTLTKGIANTLKRDGVHVFGVNLGWTVTPSEHEVQTRIHGMPQDWADEIGKNQPFGRLLMPQDVMDLVALLRFVE